VESRRGEKRIRKRNRVVRNGRKWKKKNKLSDLFSQSRKFAERSQKHHTGEKERKARRNRCEKRTLASEKKGGGQGRGAHRSRFDSETPVSTSRSANISLKEHHSVFCRGGGPQRRKNKKRKMNNWEERGSRPDQRAASGPAKPSRFKVTAGQRRLLKEGR